MHKPLRLASLALAVIVLPYALEGLTTEDSSLPDAESLTAQAGGNRGGGTGGGQGNSGGGQGNQGGGNGGGQGNQGGGNGGGQGTQGGGNGGGQGNQGGGNGGGNANQGRNGNGTPGAGGGGDSGRSTIRGRGLRQHAAALDHVLQRHGVHINAASHMYDFFHPSVHPAAFASRKEERAWAESMHRVTCSMFLYLQQLREARPRLRVDYVDWIVDRVAETLGEDRTEVEAALLGFPHQHDHTSALLRSISEIGCARGPQASPEEREAVGEEHALHVHSADVSPRFTIADDSTESELVFRVTESDAVFTDYGVSHEKEMHLLIVREDLRHFAHLHPERDADGTWRVRYAPPAGGTYWFYVDFVDSAVTHFTVRFDRTYAGDPGATGFVPDTGRVKKIGAYTVELEELSYEGGMLFKYHINDQQGGAPFLEPYLGSMGHGILISPEGDFIHTHPSPVGDHLTLHLPPPHGTYRMFTQFQIHGEVQTVEFDWLPEAHGHEGHGE